MFNERKRFTSQRNSHKLLMKNILLVKFTYLFNLFTYSLTLKKCSFSFNMLFLLSLMYLGLFILQVWLHVSKNLFFSAAALIKICKKKTKKGLE